MLCVGRLAGLAFEEQEGGAHERLGKTEGPAEELEQEEPGASHRCPKVRLESRSAGWDASRKSWLKTSARVQLSQAHAPVMEAKLGRPAHQSQTHQLSLPFMGPPRSPPTTSFWGNSSAGEVHRARTCALTLGSTPRCNGASPVEEVRRAQIRKAPLP